MDGPVDETVRLPAHEWLRKQARATPQATAIVAEARSHTYRELDRWSDAIAVRLIDIGVRPGSVVVIAMDRSPLVIASCLAVLKAGAAYSVLDLSDPIERHRWTITDCQPAAILTSQTVAATLPSSEITTLLADNIKDNAASPPQIKVSCDAPACVMYTSGSTTGHPKGALIPHRGITRLFSRGGVVPFGPEFRMLAHSPMHFDAITFEIWGPLLCGGATVPFTGGAVPLLHEFRDDIRRFGVNALFLGPALFNLIIDEEPHLLDPIRTMIVGGDALSASHIRKAQKLLPETNFINGYGPTETTTFATMYSIPRPLPESARSVPIGTPITNTRCYLLTSDQQPVADGEDGELFLGGDGVALGYLGQPELTARHFVPDPFARQSTAMMYRTGDQCRQLDDGTLQFLGRIDDQVKINGRRIEPSETELNILKFPGIKQCVVRAIEDRGNKRLACYYVSANGGRSENDLIQFLEQRLPAYLIPQDFVRLGEMPRTPNGKINRAALPSVARDDEGNTPTAPESADVQALVELWRQVLQSPQVGPESNFYEAGGTSLDAVRLCCLIERKTGIFIDIGTLIANPQPRQLATTLRTRSSGNSKRRDQSPVLLHANADSTGPTLFCISGYIWNPRTLLPVTSQMTSVAAALGVCLPGIEHDADVLRSTHETARYACEQVRASQSAGPYFLLGYSYGGILALEVARQLQASGETVQQLILLDVDLPGTHGIHKSSGQRLLIHARHALRGGPRVVVERMRDRSRRRREAATPTAEDRPSMLLQKAQFDCEAAFKQYQPTIYQGDVLIVQSTEKPMWAQFTHTSTVDDWRKLIRGNIATATAPGDHYSIIKHPNAEAVAGVIDEYLRRHTHAATNGHAAIAR